MGSDNRVSATGCRKATTFYALQTTCYILFFFPLPASAQNPIAATLAENPARNFHFVAARLLAGRDTALAWGQLDSLLAEPTGDMFWTYPATAFYFYFRDFLTDEHRAAYRRVWKEWTPYRGDTENHFLMYYETLYLMAQEWPDLPGTEWFNGKSSEENFREAEEYLDHWIEETTRYGQTEWDSPRYFYFYVLPLLTLYDHADDPRMAKQAGMMLELLLADYAVDYLDGRYCGAHSRDGDGSVIDPLKAEARAWSDFWWEDSVSLVLPDLVFALRSDFDPPDIIRRIAHDRSRPLTSFEQKRSRAKMRYSDELYTPVYRTTYMTERWAIGSIQGGLQQPIQQHTWDITFATERPNSTIYALHPYASAHELGMFFPEEPELMEAGILASKASYGSSDKPIGGSPFEEIRQHRGTLFGHYEIPVDTRFAHVDFILPSALFDDELRTIDGWMLLRVEGEPVGIRIDRAASQKWIRGEKIDRLRLTGEQIDYTVVIGVGAEGSDQEVIARMTAQAGRDSATAHAVPTFTDQLFLGPHLKSERGTGIITMRQGGEVRVLDFIEGTIVTE